MSKIEKTKLDLLVDNLEENYKTKDIFALLHKLKINYSKTSDLKNKIKKLDDLFIEIKIANNSNQSLEFELIRELGNALLFMGYLRDKKLWDEQKKGEEYVFTNEENNISYEFVLSYLMPFDIFKSVMEENSYCKALGNRFNQKTAKIYNINAVAKYFRLPDKIIIDRAEYLNYFIGRTEVADTLEIDS